MPRKLDKRKIMECSCGYKSGKDEDIKTTITEKIKIDEKKVEIIEKEDFETLPKTSVECEKCKNTQAYFWTLQTRASDEPETKFYKCIKCRHTWRDYN